MYIIGITGGTGAGKSSAVNALRTLGAYALDCDAIYHEVLSDNTEMIAEIEAHFNNVSSGGVIDRKKLGEIVWNDPAALQKLNEITHKFMNTEIDKRISALKAQGVKIAAVDAIALIESGQGKKCDIVVGILAPQEKRLSRIMRRDNLTKEQALRRINAQQPESFFREKCDHTLENIYDFPAEFEEKCIEFFKSIQGASYEQQSGNT